MTGIGRSASLEKPIDLRAAQAVYESKVPAGGSGESAISRRGHRFDFWNRCLGGLGRRVIPYLLLALAALAFAVVADALDWSGGTTFAVGAAAVFIFALITAPFVLGERGDPPTRIIERETRVIVDVSSPEPERGRLVPGRSATTAGAPRNGHPAK
jgi:hypothetical protein